MPELYALCAHFTRKSGCSRNIKTKRWGVIARRQGRRSNPKLLKLINKGTGLQILSRNRLIVTINVYTLKHCRSRNKFGMTKEDFKKTKPATVLIYFI